MTLKTDSIFIKHIQCLKCKSSDANCLYDDGHTWCQSCSTYRATCDVEDIEDVKDIKDIVKTVKKPKESLNTPAGATISAIPERKIQKATCEKFGVLQDAEKHYYVYDGGVKTRYVASKDFSWVGMSDKLFARLVSIRR